jgi:hypothetical protein
MTTYRGHTYRGDSEHVRAAYRNWGIAPGWTDEQRSVAPAPVVPAGYPVPRG